MAKKKLTRLGKGLIKGLKEAVSAKQIKDPYYERYGMTRKELDVALKHALKICKQFKVYQAK